MSAPRAGVSPHPGLAPQQDHLPPARVAGSGDCRQYNNNNHYFYHNIYNCDFCHYYYYNNHCFEDNNLNTYFAYCNYRCQDHHHNHQHQ